MSQHELQYLETEGTLRTFSIVQDIVAQKYGKQSYELKVKDKPSCIVEPRQVVMFIGFMFLAMTCKAVGSEYGKHHATVLHANQTVKNLYWADKQFRTRLDEISEQIGITHERLQELLSCRKSEV